MRHDGEGDAPFVDDGASPTGVAGTIGVGGSTPLVEDAGAGNLGGTSESGGAANQPEQPPDPPEAPPDDPEPCDPHGDPLDPSRMAPCRPAEPNARDCDELAREYEGAVGKAQWCSTDAECHAGHVVASTLRCGCDVVVRTVADIAPLAAQWRAQGCVNDLPCSVPCFPADMPYRCGEAGFCLPEPR